MLIKRKHQTKEKTEEIVNICQFVSQKIAALNTRRNLLKKEANFFFRRNCAMAVTHQYHLNTMHESAIKGEFVTFAVKGILLGCMATKPARKIELVMAMILGRIMVPWHVQLPR